MFEKAIEHIRSFIRELPNHQNKRLFDLYGGVGTIGILTSDLVQEVVCVEAHANAERFALYNAWANQIHDFSFTTSKTEKSQLSAITSHDIVILDPPRAGLHPKVIKELVARKPAVILYLSCNPKTQAQDYALLKEFYALDSIHAYNFYPRTMHCEVLVVLTLKN
jgi:tRNA/tmRNA/rRNA uracil-C5-methylase (TrmA/RlmC/RlmD family)